MKVLVAAGMRAFLPYYSSPIFTMGEFSHARTGELVMPYVAWEFLGVCDPQAHRALAGIKTKMGTTVFKVVDMPITLEKLTAKFLVSLKNQGWTNKKPFALFSEDEMEWVAASFARSMVRAASKFNVGDIIQKTNCRFRSLTKPNIEVKVIVARARPRR